MTTSLTQRVRRVRSADTAKSVTVKIDANVVDGRISSSDLAEWVSAAISHYHTFRGGNVGQGPIVGGILRPTVTLVE